MFAPICLFVFDRPFHTERVLSSLAENVESKNSILYIYSDGIPENCTKERLDNIILTRKIISNEKRFKEVNITFRNKNLGLSYSLINGISEVCEKHGKIIVLEDDLVVEIFFLNYMNKALEVYEFENKIGAICGYFYPVLNLESYSETFCLNYNSCWGWATWQRSWSNFEENGELLLTKIKSQNLNTKFDYNNTRYHTKMLENQVLGRNNSWAIRWAATLFLNNQLSLFPKMSLVDNIGFDGSGFHSGFETTYDVVLMKDKISNYTNDIKENESIKIKLERFFNSNNKKEFINRLKRIISYSPYEMLNKIKSKFK